jgi:single-strand DNA-binding protein
MDLNKVQLIGRVTKDVEVKTVSNGNKVANFSLATNRYWTDQSGQKQTVAEFHNCVVWGKLADIAESYVQKGKKIYFEGRNETRSWEAEDGTKRYKTDIVGENIILLDSANSNNT